jgi:Xaa-Pro aminopeptidase
MRSATCAASTAVAAVACLPAHRRTPGAPRLTLPPPPGLRRLRLRKSPGELALMRASAEAAAGALRRCMQISHPGVRESSLAATFGERGGGGVVCQTLAATQPACWAANAPSVRIEVCPLERCIC